MDVYLRLDYDDYKELERQLENFRDLETTHTTTSGFYHKALRVRIGSDVFEFQGPLVKEPVFENASTQA